MVLKVDYDPVSNTDGDDWYDMLKIGLMSRPLLAKKPTDPYDRLNRGMDVENLVKAGGITTSSSRVVWAVTAPKPPWLLQSGKGVGSGKRSTEDA